MVFMAVSGWAMEKDGVSEDKLSHVGRVPISYRFCHSAGEADKVGLTCLGRLLVCFCFSFWYFE